jgi:solute:Na+ symporter, SSS family
MLQTLPAVMIALYTRWFHRWGLLAGWAVGMVVGTWIAAKQAFEPVWEMPVLEVTAYTALVALVLNLVVAVVVTLVLGDRGRADDQDETRPEDYDELEETREPAPTVGAGVA